MGLFGDHLERFVGVSSGEQRGGDGHGSVDPALTPLGGPVQARVPHSDARLACQYAHHVEVVLAERAPVALLGEVEGAQALALYADGDGQEAGLGRRTDPLGPRGPPGLLVPVRQPPDPPDRLPAGVLARVLGEAVPALRRQTDRRVPRVRQLRRGLADPLQRGPQPQTAADRPHRFQQPRYVVWVRGAAGARLD